MSEQEDPKYAKASISLKDTITSTPKQRQTYKRNVNDYNTKVRTYYTEKDRVEAENKRRQEEYNQKLKNYNAQQSRLSRNRRSSSVPIDITKQKQQVTGQPTNYNNNSNINIFVNKESTPEKPNFGFTPILKNKTYIQNQSQERYKFKPLFTNNINKPKPPEVLPTPEVPKFTFKPLLKNDSYQNFVGSSALNKNSLESKASSNLKSGDSNTPIYTRSLTETEKTFSNQISSQRTSSFTPEKKTYLGELKSEVKSRYINPYITPIVKGIKTTVNNPREAGRILKTESLPNLKAGFSSVANLQTNSYNSLVNRQKTPFKDRLSNLKNVVLVPGEIQRSTYNKKPDFSPTKLAKASVIFGETALVMEAPRIATGIKNLGLRTIGKEVPAETLYSEVARKSPSGIDATFNPKKTIDTFKKSQKNVKGTALEGLYPDEYMIGSSSTGNKFSTNRVLSKTELGQPMNETGGTFISPIKAGQPRFLRLAGEKTGSELSLNPFEIFTNKSNPTTYTVGLKEVRELPKRLISKEPSVFKDIETFQRSRVGRSEAYITRESSLGIKREPEAVLNVGQTFKEPILKQPLYTKLNGQTVRVRPIYLDENPNLIRQTSKIKNNLIDDLPINNNVKGIRTRNITSLDRQKISGDYYYNINSSKKQFPYTVLNSGYKSKSIIDYKTSTVPVYTSNKKSLIESSNKLPTTVSYTYPKINNNNYKTYNFSTPSYTEIKSSKAPSYAEKYSYLVSPNYSEKLPYLSSSPKYSERYPSLTGTTDKRTSKPIFKRRTESSKVENEKDTSYKVEIKSKGKWATIKDKTKRDFGSAFNKGASLVDNFSERSFRLKSYKAKPTSRESVSPISNKFYQPAKSPTLRSAFVERTPYLIDTPGEVRGISYKGQQAQKKKVPKKKNIRGIYDLF